MSVERIFLDMDGVLCDYYAGVCRAINREPWPYLCRKGEWNFFAGEPFNLTNSDVASWMDRRFYANLGWLPDGLKLVEACAELVGAKNVFLLTSPWDTEGCHAGKVDWVKTHLREYFPRLLIGSPKEVCSRPGAVLVDDSEINCAKFASVENPGRAVLMPRQWNRRHNESDHWQGHAIDLATIVQEIASGT